MGQVAHALLTRPPLTHRSLGFPVRPFDLHVLGTPPAFILSQDQTLMFLSPAGALPLGFPCGIPQGPSRPFFTVFWVAASCPAPMRLRAPGTPLAFRRCSFFMKLPSLNIPETFVPGIFRVALLFICQGSAAASLRQL